MLWKVCRERLLQICIVLQLGTHDNLDILQHLIEVGLQFLKVAGCVNNLILSLP